MFTLYYNGNFHTLNYPPYCSALLIQNNQIVYCGNVNDINLPADKIRKINLSGFSVFPSFIDCHTHFAMASKKLDQVSLDHCRTFDDIIKEIKSNIRRFKKGTWIKGGGWNSNLWSGFIPDKTHLDLLTNDHPIALFNKDLHTMWLNSLALKICGLDSEIPADFKNKVKYDVDGKPTGIVFEDVCQFVEEKSKEHDSRNQEENLIKFSDKLLKNGITSAHSMENLTDLDLFMKLHLNKKLKTRICFHPPTEEIQTMANAKLHSGYGNEWLRFGGLKYYVDGSLGSQTAEMFERYHYLNHAGIEMMTKEELTQKIQYAALHGLSATVHAIGDKANHKTLNAFEDSLQYIKSQVPLRNRIEHSQIVIPDDIRRFAQMNIIASMQPLHIADDVRISDKYLGDRAKNAYPINSMLKSGVRVVFGSDTPVADYNPFKVMQAAISRRYNLDPKEECWYPKERISIFEAIKGYTIDASYASYEETIKGSLQPGKLADFVILSKDLMNSANPEETLKTVEVVGTILDGKTEYINDKYNIFN